MALPGYAALTAKKSSSLRFHVVNVGVAPPAIGAET